MKLAILGGSFNPIHIGHLFLADTVLSSLHYDRVVLVPAFRSPFKPEAGIEDRSADRLEMAAASIAGDPRLTVDDCEIMRGGVSYTADTVQDIIRRYVPEGKPGLVIGDDLAADFLWWKRSADILDMADIIIARRVRSGKPDVSYPHTQIDNDIVDISSVAVREKIATGAAWHYLVPAAARTIIEDRRLYRCKNTIARRADPDFNAGALSGDFSKSLIIRVEEAVRENLTLKRFLHSRNTALLARDMCVRLRPLYAAKYGEEAAAFLDGDLGYLAGIAHDLAKQTGAHDLMRLAESDGRKITRLEKEKPSLLHGRASAVLLKKRFHVHNEAVLEAAAFHTGGGENMGPLAKVVYIADKMEVSRGNVEPEIRNLVFFENDLDKIFYAVFSRNVSRVRAKKQELSEETLRLLEKMKKMPEIKQQEGG